MLVDGAAPSAANVPHGGQPEAPALAERAHHVEDDAGLARLVEVQAVAHHDVEQVVGRERAVRGDLDVVAGDEVLLLAAGAVNSAGLRVVGAVGEELQREERVRRAALAQVDLDRVRLPLAVRVPDGDEVEREAADHALASPAARRPSPPRA